MRYVETWAAEDERVRIIRNPQNLGSGPSRNAGIEIARGEYYSFIDPDDWISDDFYENLYANDIKTNCDIIKGFSVSRKDGRCKQEFQDQPVNQTTNNTVRHQLQSELPLYLRFTVQHWSAIYKCSLFRDTDVRYGETLAGEDVTFLLKACYNTDSLSVINDSVYFYRKRAGSATAAYSFKLILSQLDAFEERIKYLQSKADYPSPMHILYLKDKTIRVYLYDFFFACQYIKLTDQEQEQYRQRFLKLVDKTGVKDFLCIGFPELEIYLSTGFLIPAAKRVKDPFLFASIERWTVFLTEHNSELTEKHYRGYLAALKKSYAAAKKYIPQKKLFPKKAMLFYCKQLFALPWRQRLALAWYLLKRVFGTARRKSTKI